AELFAEAVAHDRDAIAVRFEGAGHSYGELDEASNRLARLLIDRGVGPESVVALMIPRSYHLVVAMWAVAKSGAAFVPVDPANPPDRVTYMLSDSAAALAITTATTAGDLPSSIEHLVIDGNVIDRSPAAVTDADRTAPLRLSNTAYMIYTSGSTGRPKGVRVTHAGLGALVDTVRDIYGTSRESLFLHAASPSFDASVLEWISTFGRAATLVIVPPSIIGGAELTELLATERVTHAFLTPAVLGTVDAESVPALEVVSAGGDVVPADLVARWTRDRTFFNMYGPTESTIVGSFARLDSGRPVTIGAPVRGMSVLVLDNRLHPVPVGVAGELYLSGAALARGYHDRAALTAERFVAGIGGERMYRTGDVVRWTRDGELQFVGRSDFQVKVRGLRIELGEIDGALTANPAIDFAVTVGHESATRGMSLVSYVVPVPGAEADPLAIRSALGDVLPSYMVPTQVIVLDRVPLTPMGKLDRKALPEPAFESIEFRAPESAVEQAVASVFAEVLDVARVGRDDDFFALGGNSLVATQMVSRLGAALDTTVPVRALFEASTVAGLAARVASHIGSGRVALASRERPERIPLSLAQSRMWFLNRFDTASAVNNIPLAIRLSGDLDVDAMRAAIGDVLERHESLRTVYPEVDGVGYQRVLPIDEARPALDVVATSTPDLAAQIADVVGRGFDLTVDLPVRIRLLRLTDAPGEHVLVFTAHHIAADGFSMSPLARDVMVAYESRARGVAPGWAPLPVQYADFAIWQREVLGAEDDSASLISRQIAFWTETLTGLPEQLNLPADRPRPAIASNRGATVAFDIGADLHARLVGLARAHDATLFMVVHAGLATLLARLSGADDIAIGTPIAGRGERELDDLVGMFVNTLVLRTRLTGDESFADLLGQARKVDVAAFGHADVPFERLVEVLNPVRSQARHPLFQVMLAFQNLGKTTFELPGLTVGSVDIEAELAKFDLSITIAEESSEAGEPAGMRAGITYATDLFDRGTVEGFAARLVRLLESVASDSDTPIGDLELLDPAERALVVSRWSTGREPGPFPGLLLDEFERHAAAAPDAVALRSGGDSLSYGDFAERVNRLARHLISLGVAPETRVAVAMRRSPELVVGVYAVLAAGGTYVPVDPDHPADRVRYVLDSADPLVVLSTSRDEFGDAGARTVVLLDAVDLAEVSGAPVGDEERIAPLRPANTAYVIYTSGSTGRPKGVAVSHASVVNQIRYISSEYDLSADDVVLLKTPATFDVSVWELFAVLGVGGRLVIATPDGHRDPRYLVAVIDEERVSVTSFVPSMLPMFATALSTSAGAGTSLRMVLVGGEALPLQTVTHFRAHSNAVVVNLYGPTECTVDATMTVLPDVLEPVIAIGGPIWHTQTYVLDARLHPVPPGVPGELYLGGVLVARGYVGRPDLTAERFVADPFEGAGGRLYRTGDLVRWLSSGELEYLGRTDFQVKLRGQRIELGEIEAALLADADVAQAVTVVRSDAVAERLVGYVVPATGRTVDADAIRAAVADRLPSYMVPDRVMVVAEFPLNASGKLDRKALPEPTFDAVTFRAPETPIEQAVAAVFAETLGIDRVGLDDDFFALGGNSLVAMQV
ncbi:MAG: amino acid adenylation domain-containing protein, partial [Aldersonia sp.]|nr:amino acid adenylation domain-containing protein [Aldersonia sp.]